MEPPRKPRDDEPSQLSHHDLGLHVDEIDALTRLVRESKRAPQAPPHRARWRAPLRLLWRLLTRLGRCFGA